MQPAVIFMSDLSPLFDLFIWPFQNWNNPLILWPLGILVATATVYQVWRLVK